MSDPELPELGDLAPSFSAEASDGATRTLAGMLERGPVVLFFYPGNDTPG